MRHEELLNKIIKQELFELYQINESFDKPFPDFTKVGDFYYVVKSGDISGIFTFKLRFSKSNHPKYYLYPDNVGVYYEANWDWGYMMKNELKTNENHIKMMTTWFKIIDDFIRTIKPDVIKFPKQNDENNKIQSEINFVGKLSSLFLNHHHVTTDIEFNMKICGVYIINKKVSKLLDDSIRKLTENCLDLKDPRKYRLYPKKRNEKGIVRNNTIKEQRKRILYTAKYL